MLTLPLVYVVDLNSCLVYGADHGNTKICAVRRHDAWVESGKRGPESGVGGSEGNDAVVLVD